jgi:hypothetical protein
MTDTEKKQLLAFAVLVPLLIWALNRGCEASRQAAIAQAPARPERVHLRPDQVEAMQTMEREGFLDMGHRSHEALLDPGVWLRADAKLKEDLAATLATYGADLRHDDDLSITVVDKQSAKKLATWDSLWGFKVY